MCDSTVLIQGSLSWIPRLKAQENRLHFPFLRGTRESKEEGGLAPDLGIAARLLILSLPPLYQGERLEMEDTR